ncbi:laminin G domain-containing protein [Streptomyces sp. DSS69]|uniref:laminin G domain-containing protein n=1 Tax=Streptomyces sp. DSS69 TaxID=3113369 RepID=UPI0031F9F07F
MPLFGHRSRSRRTGARPGTAALTLPPAATALGSAATGARPIIWGYGMGSGVRQFWLRAEPASGTPRAAIDTGGAFASVRTTSAYNDGQWHHAVVKRQAGRLLLSMDGGPEFSAPAPAGDTTPALDVAREQERVRVRPGFSSIR